MATLLKIVKLCFGVPLLMILGAAVGMIAVLFMAVLAIIFFIMCVVGFPLIMVLGMSASDVVEKVKKEFSE